MDRGGFLGSRTRLALAGLIAAGVLVGSGCRGSDEHANPGPDSPAPVIPAATLVAQGVDTWTFAYPGLTGVLSGGHEAGVELTEGADGQRVTRQMNLNLEHYLAAGLGGSFVPRSHASVVTEQVDDHSIRLTIAPNEIGNVTVRIIYSLLPDRVIEAEYEFTFGSDHRNFEGIVSHYFHEPAAPFVPIGGEWVQPVISDTEHRFWARGPAQAAMVLDGRWNFVAQMGFPEVSFVADSRYYDEPVLISPTSDPDWYVVHIAERAGSSSLSANTKWQAHDFGLVGRDVSAGETVTVRAWMVYTQLSDFDEAFAWQARLAP
jgi:hypothetical protein